MRKVICLYLEDDNDQRSRYKGWLERAWKKLCTGTEINVKGIDDPSKAIEMLRETPEKFNLFVVDILFGKGKAAETLGFTAISQAREDHNDLAIVAFSIGNGGFEQEAIDAGADVYVSKRYLATPRQGNYLGEKLLEALRKRGFEPVSADVDTLHIDEDELELVALVETVGRGNIINFVSRILEEPPAVVYPYYVRSGLSGASVLRVDCDLNVAAGSVPRFRKLLLKISKDRETLCDEVSKSTSEFPEELFVKFLKNEPVTSGDWHSIAANFKDQSKTLLDWLFLKEVSAEDVTSTLKKLFINIGLKEVYSRIGRSEERRPNVALWEILSPSRRARVRKALKEFRSLAEKHDPSRLFDFDLLDAFIKSKRIDQRDEEAILKGTSFCWSHGDFHGRNILIKMIDKYGIPSLIDPANIDQMHWAADISRLIVDLIVSGLDTGDESHEWEKMGEWCDLAVKFINEETLPKLDENSSNKNVYVCLSWIRENLSEIHDISDVKLKPEWEFRLALAIEFLRASYRHQDLPTPKRVLGLLAACEALRSASRSYEEHKKLL